MTAKQGFPDYKKETPHALISMKSEENEKFMNKNTAIAYIRVWRDFSEYLDNAEVHSFDDFTKAHIMHFLSKFKMKPFAYNQARSAIIKILIDIEDDYDVAIPKLESIKRQAKAVKVKSDDRLFLTVAQLNKVRDGAAYLFQDRAVRERNLLIYDLIMHSMMRVDEIALIQISDIDITSKTLGVRGKGASGDTKGNRVVSARIPLSSKIISQMTDYLRSWRSPCKNDPSKPYLDYPMTIRHGMPLFTSAHGKAVDVSTIKKAINSMIKHMFHEECKPVPKNHGAHCIRRSVATIIYNKNKDIILIQRMLRHASHVTTMQYIGVDERELKAAFLDDL